MSEYQSEDKNNKMRQIHLPSQVQTQMQQSFSADFSGVRFFESENVEENGALAAARGSDIAFAPGQFRPETRQGQELIGHELAHVVQQSRGGVGGTQYKSENGTVNADHTLEQQADFAGFQAARGETVSEGAGMQQIAPMQSSMAPIQAASARKLDKDQKKAKKKEAKEFMQTVQPAEGDSMGNAIEASAEQNAKDPSMNRFIRKSIGEVRGEGLIPDMQQMFPDQTGNDYLDATRDYLTATNRIGDISTSEAARADRMDAATNVVNRLNDNVSMMETKMSTFEDPIVSHEDLGRRYYLTLIEAERAENFRQTIEGIAAQDLLPKEQLQPLLDQIPLLKTIFAYSRAIGKIFRMEEEGVKTKSFVNERFAGKDLTFSNFKEKRDSIEQAFQEARKQEFQEQVLALAKRDEKEAYSRVDAKVSAKKREEAAKNGHRPQKEVEEDQKKQQEQEEAAKKKEESRDAEIGAPVAVVVMEKPSKEEMAEKEEEARSDLPPDTQAAYQENIREANELAQKMSGPQFNRPVRNTLQFGNRAELAELLDIKGKKIQAQSHELLKENGLTQTQRRELTKNERLLSVIQSYAIQLRKMGDFLNSDNSYMANRIIERYFGGDSNAGFLSFLKAYEG